MSQSIRDHQERIPDPFGASPPSVEAEELQRWILFRDDDLLVIDKPGWLVCHPSKKGPRSSLVGACRAWLGLERIHLVSRLDRETSGIVVLALHPEAASRAQKAVQEREVRHGYLALLDGELESATEIDAPLAPAPDRRVRARVAVWEAPARPQSSAPEAGHAQGFLSKSSHREPEMAPRPIRQAQTRFEPLHAAGGLTLARVWPRTGRKHQIRAHAAHLGHPVAGDKIYGPDESLFLDFIDGGWNERLDAALPIKRQALHRDLVAFEAENIAVAFEAPFPSDMARLAWQRMGLDSKSLEAILQR